MDPKYRFGDYLSCRSASGGPLLASSCDSCSSSSMLSGSDPVLVSPLSISSSAELLSDCSVAARLVSSTNKSQN